MDPLVKLANELDRLRAARGLGVRQLADRCQLSRGTMYYALHRRDGQPIPTVNTVVRICQVLGVPSEPLVDLRNRGKAEARTPPAGPRAADSSRQFTRETNELTGLFNPLRRENLERSVQWALEAAPPIPLGQAPKTKLDGIYALYYVGAHDVYKAVSSRACSVPLYVGKATRPGVGPRGSATGALQRRLKELRHSIEQSDDLDVPSFRVRYLPVDDIFAAGAERLMIGDHRPVWNTVLNGFGNHNPGPRRHGAQRSGWDELHPGRPWALQQAPCHSNAQELRTAVLRHLTD